MKKLITILFMLFSIVSFAQPNIDAYRVRARNWIIYGNDTIFRPTHIDAADYQIKTVADPTDDQDAVNLRTMNAFAGDSTFTTVVIRDSLFIFSDTIIYITGGDSLITKEYVDSLFATLPGGHDPVTLAPSATTGGLTISASQVVGFQPSSATSNGYLSAANFTLFFNKLTTVSHDATLTGLGTVASPLKVDTTLIATKAFVGEQGDDWGSQYVVLNSDSLLKGRGTTATPLRADSTLLATKAFTNLNYVQLGDSLTKWVTFKQLIDSLGTLPGGHNPVTLGTANGLSLSTQELSLNTANAGTTGAILNTDWVSFNAKMDSVNRLSPLTGYGTTVNPLGIDTTTYVATKYDLTSVVAGSITLSGQVTGSGTGTIATVLDKTAITGQDLNASIATNDTLLIYDQSGADLDKTSVANFGAVNGAFDAGWLQNVAVSSTAPFNNYVLLYDSITTQWKPSVSPSSKWAADTYGINYQLGSVGIGTVSEQSSALRVNQSTASRYGINVIGGSSSNGLLIQSGYGSSYKIIDLWNAPLMVNAMNITSDGRVNFPLYGTSSTFDGAVTKLLGVDATGKVYATSGFAGGEVTSVAGTYVDNQIPRFTGTSGDTLQTSPYPVTINDSGQLAVAATYSGDYGARFINNSSLGYGALIQGGNTATQDILRLSSYGGTMQFQFKPTGTMYAHNLGTGKTDSVLYWNATTKQITVGDIPTGSGVGDMTKAVYDSDDNGIFSATNGGTNSAYFAVTGPATSIKTFTFPNVSASVLTTATAVMEIQGGTGFNTYTTGDLLYSDATNSLAKLPIGTNNYVLTSNGTTPQWSPSTSVPGGTTGQIQFNNAGVFGGITGSSVSTNSITLAGTATASNFILSSDRRLKSNIRDIRDLSWVDKLEFKQFTMKDDLSDRLRFGLIAQDVVKLQPSVVYTNEKGEMALGYTEILVSVVARQKEQIDDLEKRIEKLEKLVKNAK